MLKFYRDNGFVEKFSPIFSCVDFMFKPFKLKHLNAYHLFSRDRTKLVIHVSLSPFECTFDHISLFCYISYTTWYLLRSHIRKSCKVMWFL